MVDKSCRSFSIPLDAWSSLLAIMSIDYKILNDYGAVGTGSAIAYDRKRVVD